MNVVKSRLDARKEYQAGAPAAFESVVLCDEGTAEGMPEEIEQIWALDKFDAAAFTFAQV